MDTDQKPTASKLYQTIRATNEAKAQMAERAKQMFNAVAEQEREMSTFVPLTEDAEAKIVELYQKAETDVEDLFSQYKLDAAQLILMVCERVWKKKALDLTKLLKYTLLEEYIAIRLVHELISAKPANRHELYERLSIAPQDLLLLLTVVWASANFREAARKFEPYLSMPFPTNDIGITEEEEKKAEEEFNAILEEHLESFKEQPMDQEEQQKMYDDFDRLFEETKQLFEESKSEMKEILDGIKSNNELLGQIPQMHIIETLISSSDESDSEPLDDEIQIATQRIITSGPRFFETIMDEEMAAFTGIHLNQFYFAPAAKLFENAAVSEGYVKSKLVEQSGDTFAMQVLLDYPIDGANSRLVSGLTRDQLAMGEAPTRRCPEGTRVIALCERAAQEEMQEAMEQGRGVVPAKYFPGTVAVQPYTHNRFEYLIFFDNGINEYVKPTDIRLLVDQPTNKHGKFQPLLAHAKLPPHSQARAGFIQKYLRSYPDWPLVQMKKSENTQRILATRNGKRESAFVLDVDRQLALLRFRGDTTGWQTQQARECVQIDCKEHPHNDEWVYRGDPERFPTLAEAAQISDDPNKARWQALLGRVQPTTSSAQLQLTKSPRMSRKLHSQFEMAMPIPAFSNNKLQILIEASKHVQTARKSMAGTSSKRPRIECEPSPMLPMARPQRICAELHRRKQLAVDVNEEQLPVPQWDHDTANLVGHQCDPKCVQSVQVQVRQMKGEGGSRDGAAALPESPYFTPLRYGWSRVKINIGCDSHQHKQHRKKGNSSGGGGAYSKRIQYIAPCGIRLNDIEQVAAFLQATGEERLTIDQFTFDHHVRPDVWVSVRPDYVKMADFAQGQEAIPIPLVNAVDEEPAPQMTYRPRRTVIKRMVDGKITEEAIEQVCTGCDCEDNCATDKCACRRLTIQEHKRLNKSLQVSNSAAKGYNHKRLDERMMNGIYECNGMCRCRAKTKNCFNRVVQLDITIPLQLFQTAEKGWGVRTLVDIPKNTFVCTYSGEILDAEMANKRSDDKYLADLDLIDQVENEKLQQGIDLIEDEGYEEDNVSDHDRSDELPHLSEDEAFDEIVDQRPSTSQNAGNERSEIDDRLALFNPAANKKKAESKKKHPQPLIEHDQFTIDAQHTGNIGRFLNHSCDPNCKTQHCLVDTHDLRLPWCAFFTSKFVRAGEELTWDYAYENKEGRIECKCGAVDKCRKFVL